jgi:hypothetical protein
MLSKSSLEWPAQATNHPRSSDEKLASAFTMRSDPLDVQAEATDADTFEALWRTRGRSSLVDGAQVEQLERYHRSCGAVVIGQGRSEHPRILTALLHARPIKPSPAAAGSSSKRTKPYPTNRRYKTKRTTKVRKSATPIRISLFSSSLVMGNPPIAGRGSHTSRRG